MRCVDSVGGDVNHGGPVRRCCEVSCSGKGNYGGLIVSHILLGDDIIRVNICFANYLILLYTSSGYLIFSLTYILL